MVPPFRRWLRRHPRVLLAVLLAFGIELTPPPTGVVSHRHEHGSAHMHAGRVTGDVALRVVTRR